MVATEEQREIIKNMYNHIKDNLDEIKKMYIENGYDLDNLQGSQKVTVKLNESRMWMLSGLYNANRQRYDTGLRKYMRYSEEMLSNGHGFTSVKMESANHYDNSEALRQCGLSLKEDYDTFKIIEASVFG